MPSPSLFSDDLIKANKAPRRSRRQSNKETTAKRDADNKPTNIQKSIGQTKAKRDAAVNARRQGAAAAAAPKKPTAMEIDREVNRVRRNKSTQPSQQQQKKKPGMPQQQQEGTGRRNRRGRGRGAAAATGTATTEIKAPTKKAVSAAVRVMKEFGFQPPKGMDVVISFAPKPTPPAQAAQGKRGGGGGGGRGGGRQN